MHNPNYYFQISNSALGGIWISTTDMGHEGQWSDVFGHQLNFSNWSPNQPDNLSNRQHCGYTNYKQGGAWDDVDCNYSGPNIKHYVCQYDNSPGSSAAVVLTNDTNQFMIEPGELTGQYGVALTVSLLHHGVRKMVLQQDPTTTKFSKTVTVVSEPNPMLEQSSPYYWEMFWSVNTERFIALGKGYCPAPNLQSIEVDWTGIGSLTFPIFRFEDRNTRNFTCMTTIYMDEDNNPEPCAPHTVPSSLDVMFNARDNNRQRDERNDRHNDSGMSHGYPSNELKFSTTYFFLLLWLSL